MFRSCLIAVLLAFSSAVLSAPKIVWFSTLQEDLSDKSGFWKRVHDLVQAAGEDLDVDLEILYAEENFIKMQQQVEAVLSNPETRPDGIIFHNYKRVGEFILDRAESLGVKSIMFNSGLDPSKKTKLPRQDYAHWIGEILPDDVYAGAELLRQLKLAADQLPARQTTVTEVLALEGNPSSQAYLARREGLERVLKQDKQLQFKQYFPADWSREAARTKFSAIIKRYPNARIMWAANDSMALGLIDGAREYGKEPGRDFVTGGVDWLSESFDAVRSGHMAVTVGGHFVEGMWALILMYDYLNGLDFAPIHGTSIPTRMLAITRDVLNRHGDLVNKLGADNLGQVDFRQFSRFHNASLDVYPFAIQYLIDRL